MLLHRSICDQININSSVLFMLYFMYLTRLPWSWVPSFSSCWFSSTSAPACRETWQRMDITQRIWDWKWCVIWCLAQMEELDLPATITSAHLEPTLTAKEFLRAFKEQSKMLEEIDQIYAGDGWRHIWEEYYLYFSCNVDETLDRGARMYSMGNSNIKLVYQSSKCYNFVVASFYSRNQ